ncbi:MAG: HD domain-containing protein [Luteibaculaceae bacterium]
MSYIYNSSFSDKFTYHNFAHTKNVVENAQRIAFATLGLNKLADYQELVYAAYFHDIGYGFSLENHEEMSAKIAEKFFSKLEFGKEKTERICNLVRSTSIKVQPKNITECIIKDADVLYLGEDSFIEKSESLREELKLTRGKVFSDYEWWSFNYNFISNHKFYTAFCNKHYAQGKENNKNAVKLRLKSINPGRSLAS